MGRELELGTWGLRGRAKQELFLIISQLCGLRYRLVKLPLSRLTALRGFGLTGIKKCPCPAPRACTAFHEVAYSHLTDVHPFADGPKWRRPNVAEAGRYRQGMRLSSKLSGKLRIFVGLLPTTPPNSTTGVIPKLTNPWEVFCRLATILCKGVTLGQNCILWRLLFCFEQQGCLKAARPKRNSSTEV